MAIIIKKKERVNKRKEVNILGRRKTVEILKKCKGGFL